MRRHTIVMILVIAVVHFGLLVLAMSNAFIIFRGPSTPGEIFWDGAMRVLLFPSGLLFEIVRTGPGQVILTGLNSLLWGAVATLVLQKLRKSTRF